MWYIGLYHSVIYNLSLTLWKIQQCIYQIEYLSSIHFHEEHIHFTGRLLLFLPLLYIRVGYFIFTCVVLFFRWTIFFLHVLHFTGMPFYFNLLYTWQVGYLIFTCNTLGEGGSGAPGAVPTHVLRRGWVLEFEPRGTGNWTLHCGGCTLARGCSVDWICRRQAFTVSWGSRGEKKNLTFQLNFTTFHVYFNFSNFYCMSTFSQLQDKNYNSW